MNKKSIVKEIKKIGSKIYEISKTPDNKNERFDIMIKEKIFVCVDKIRCELIIRNTKYFISFRVYPFNCNIVSLSIDLMQDPIPSTQDKEMTLFEETLKIMNTVYNHIKKDNVQD